MIESWERRVYDRYISTGNLPSIPNPKLVYGPSQRYLEKVVRDHIQPITTQDAVMLELACGTAPLVYLLKSKGYTNLIGIDASPEQVMLAHTLGLQNEVFQADMLSFLDTAEPASFDMIFMFDILEHFVPEDQFNIMDKVYDKLKKGGRVLLHVPNGASAYGTRVLYSDITHKTAFSPRSLQQLLLTVGFSTVHCYEEKPIVHNILSLFRRILYEIVTFFQVIMLATATGNLRRSQYIMSMNIFAVAEKQDHCN